MSIIGSREEPKLLVVAIIIIGIFVLFFSLPPFGMQKYSHNGEYCEREILVMSANIATVFRWAFFDWKEKCFQGIRKAF